MVAAEEDENDSDPCHLLVADDDEWIATETKNKIRNKEYEKQIENQCIFKKICRMNKRV